MKEKIRCFTIKIPIPLWRFMKTHAARKDTTMTDIVIKQLNKYRDKELKKLDINNNVAV